MIKVINKKSLSYFTPNCFYVARGSVFGNPFTHLDAANTKAQFQCSTREEAIQKYRDWFDLQLLRNDDFKIAFDEMVEKIRFQLSIGKIVYLVCYCYPKSCHAEYIRDKILEKL